MNEKNTTLLEMLDRVSNNIDSLDDVLAGTYGMARAEEAKALPARDSIPVEDLQGMALDKAMKANERLISLRSRLTAIVKAF